MMNKLIAPLCLVCLVLASCASTGTNGTGTSSTGGQGKESSEPQYLIKAQSDNGFVAAYQAHFAIEGSSITEISARKFESLTLGSGSNYKAFSAKIYSFDAIAKGNNPDSWEYTQNQYDKDIYYIHSLIWDLKQMNLGYSGKVYILVTAFDGYRIIQATNLDGNTVIAESYAVFLNEDRLSLPKGAALHSLRSFYRRK